MKNLIYKIAVAWSCMLLAACSTDIFDNIKDEVKSEHFYVGKFEKAEANVGFNRVEIDLMNAGRIPSKDMKLGKATKTVVEYDGKTVTIDSVVSWVSLKDLTEPKLYRIQIYASDDYGNRSLPVECAVVPYTYADAEVLLVPSPEKINAPNAAELLWTGGMSETFFQWTRMVCTYPDSTGQTITKVVDRHDGDLALFLNRMKTGETTVAHLAVTCYPKQGETPILDTIVVESDVTLTLPTIESYLSTRTPRTVRSALIYNSAPSAIFEASTEHNVFDEVRYTTTGGEQKTVRCWADEILTACPDADLSKKFSTRSGFCPPAATDTLFLPWQEFRHEFSEMFPLGTYKVLQSSFRNNWSDTEPTSPIPQSEFNDPRDIEITEVEPGKYHVTDMFGGYYNIGREYGPDYTRWADIVYAGGNEYIISDFFMDPWSWGLQSVQCSWNKATGLVTMVARYGKEKDGYWFHLNLQQ